VIRAFPAPEESAVYFPVLPQTLKAEFIAGARHVLTDSTERAEGGQASGIPISCGRSGSHPSTDGLEAIKGR
jgi:hypothetical protein